MMRVLHFQRLFGIVGHPVFTKGGLAFRIHLLFFIVIASSLPLYSIQYAQAYVQKKRKRLSNIKSQQAKMM